MLMKTKSSESLAGGPSTFETKLSLLETLQKSFHVKALVLSCQNFELSPRSRCI